MLIIKMQKVKILSLKSSFFLFFIRFGGSICFFQEKVSCFVCFRPLRLLVVEHDCLTSSYMNYPVTVNVVSKVEIRAELF